MSTYTAQRPPHLPLGRGRIALVTTELFIGVSAVAGGIGLVGDGLGMPTSWLEGSPFADYTIPGLFLLVVIGGGMLASAGASWSGSSSAALGSLAMSLVLILWLAIETAIIGFQGPLQIGFLALYGSLAVLQLWLVLRKPGAGFLHSETPRGRPSGRLSA